jgi:hypothetical protein
MALPLERSESAVVRILLVDDQETNLDALEAILDSPDYRLVRARSADEALLHLLHEEFAAIVLDIRMPGIGGIELAHLIKKRRRTQHIPILFLTAYLAEEKEVLRGYGAGGVDYLSKPIDAGILRSKVAVFVDLFRKTRALAAANEALEGEIAERQRAQEALRLVNEALEVHVQERTAELMHANGALRETEERLRMAAEVAEIVVGEVLHPSGQVRGGPDLARLLALPAGEVSLSAEEAFAFIHPEDRERVRRAGEEAVAPGGTGTTRCEFRVLGRDRSVRWVDMRAHILPSEAPAGPVPARLVCVLLDITARKHAEEERTQLLESERAARSEAERANRLKDEFLATLSHELRTPLNAIMGWAQILKRRRLSPADQTQAIEVIDRNARAQARIIGDLLDMSLVVAGKVRLEPRAVDFMAVVRSALDSIRPVADGKGLRLVQEAGPSGPHGPYVTGDPARLHQIIANLLTNAVKFTPSGGTVSVSLRRSEGAVELEVRDTGRGIAPEFLPQIFERFRQADASSTRLFGGLGLGLAIVKSLVELHGGTVSAHSAGEGQGATFTVRLPAIEGPVEESGAGGRPGAGASALRGVSVLVVEDDGDARELVRRILEESEACVVPADSVKEALRRLSESHPHVIVSDIGMPDEDGYELIRRVRALPPERGGRTPAVALTAYARSEDEHRALLAGYDAHLPKPVESTELVARIAELCASHAAGP